MPPILTLSGPGIGEGWTRLAAAIRTEIPVDEIDRVWVFRAIRRDTKDWGTAIISRVGDDRRRIYTAQWSLTVKGKTRGQFHHELVEIGSGPLEALEELLALVPKRADDEEPPISISPRTWFPPEHVPAESA
jgi:hypothetical protein